MSNYTISVKNLVRTYGRGKTMREKIATTVPYIFDFPYPIWKEEYKRTLETKILMHYFNREICSETLGLWKLMLEERMNLIMPYYIDLYKTLDKEIDWLSDVDIKETREGNKTDNASSATSGSSEQISKGESTQIDSENSLNSDLPQATLGGVDYATTSSEKNSNSNLKNTGSVTNTSTSNGNSDFQSNTNEVASRKGLSGNRTRVELLMEYRKSILNIDKDIIDSLEDMFMLIY